MRRVAPIRTPKLGHELPDEAAGVGSCRIVELMPVVSPAPGVAESFNDNLAQKDTAIGQVISLSVWEDWRSILKQEFSA